MSDPYKVNVTDLEGDGSFDSPECVELLKEADIIVTNPPFSIIRKLFDLLIDYKKKFIIIGPTTAPQYKRLMGMLQSGEFQCGVNYVKDFINRGQLKKVAAVWYTNVENDVPKKKLRLTKEYYPHRYPHYDNYDAIEVSDSLNIPMDYFGVMGVPVSYLKFHNPEQFDIVGYGDSCTINGKEIFMRFFIKRKYNDNIPEPSLW